MSLLLFDDDDLRLFQLPLAPLFFPLAPFRFLSFPLCLQFVRCLAHFPMALLRGVGLLVRGLAHLQADGFLAGIRIGNGPIGEGDMAFLVDRSDDGLRGSCTAQRYEDQQEEKGGLLHARVPAWPSTRQA